MSQIAKAPNGARRPFRLIKGISRLSDLADGASGPVDDIFLNTFAGSDAQDGKSWGSAVATMDRALDLVETGGRVFFVGDVREEITGSNLKFDISIIGCGGLHHPDQPSSAYNYGASMWRPPSSPTAATNLLVVRGRGWRFINIAFDTPVDAAAVYLSRNASSGTDEYDASHAVFDNCRFLSGYYGINDNGGANNITIRNCEFATQTACAIWGSSTSVANPRAWKIFDNVFPANVSSLGNAVHIDLSLNESVIARNFFGTVSSTGYYINLTGGNGNMVTENFLMGAYNTSDYVAGTGDSWFGNQAISISFGTSGTDASGRTIGVPEAAT